MTFPSRFCTLVLCAMSFLAIFALPHTAAAQGTIVIDDDDNMLDITEGGDTVVFKVQLSEAPDATVTVTVTAGTGVTVSPGSLTFETDDWNEDQDVTVTATEDDDVGDESVTITLSAEDGGYDDVSSTVTVDVTDDDEGSLDLPSDDVEVDEGGTATFDVELDKQPGADVTVTLTAGTGVTVSPASLTFTTGNWDDDQEVTVSATEDDDVGDESVTITLSAADGGYDGVSGTVDVDVTDDDEGSLDLPSSAVAIDEGGTATFEVKLGAKPGADVTVTLTQPTTNTDITVDTDTSTNGNQTTLTFTSANWDMAQMVTVTAAEDNDITNDTASIAISTTSTSGSGYETSDSVSGTVTVNETDNDEIELVLPSDDVEVAEGGTKTFNVKLGAHPSGDVTVTLTQPSNTDVTVDTDTTTNGNQTTLTFTNANWNTDQTVTVSAAQDDNAGDEDVSISISADGGVYDDVSGTVSVDVKDDEDGNLTISSTDVAITEGGTATFDVELDKQPGANVTVSLAQPSNADVTVDTDSSTNGNQNTLTFTDANWNTAQRVTVSAAQDTDVGDESTSIAVSATGIAGSGYDNVSDVTVNVELTDDDEGSLVISSDELDFNEGGTETFDVKLGAQPGANVTVTLAQPSNSDVRVDTDTTTTGNQHTLTFTRANWDTNQTVTVSAADDNDLTDDTASIAISTSGASGSGYATSDGLSATVSVDVEDNDEVKLVLSSAAVSVNEGSTATFNVKLGAYPTADVTVTLTQPRNTDVTVDADSSTTGDQNTLTFTNANWDTNRTVTVSAAADDDILSEIASISISATGGLYDKVPGIVNVDVKDDDAVVLAPKVLTINEGSTRTFDVKLGAYPGVEVTVTVTTQPNYTNVTLDTDTATPGDQNTLTFTNANWNTNQRVTVSVAEDRDVGDETMHIVLSAPGTGVYDRVRVNVRDNDNGTLILPSAAVSVPEGGSATFDVILGHPPLFNVTVTLTQPSNTDVKVDTVPDVDTDPDTAGNQNTLTFTADNWNIAQSVTVKAMEDGDDTDDSATISLSASGGGYNETGTVTVSVVDNDEKELIIEPASLTVHEEGAAGSFGVRLGAKPSANVTVTLTAQGVPSEVSIDADPNTTGNQNTLTFTTANWDTEQRVSVSAAADRYADDHSFDISLTGAGGGYAGKTGSIAVKVDDDEEAEFLLSTENLTVYKGGSGMFGLRLAARPTSTMTVTLTAPSNSGIVIDTEPDTAGNQNTVTFAQWGRVPAAWNYPENVMVSVPEDDDPEPRTVTISLSADGRAPEYSETTASVQIEVSKMPPSGHIVLDPLGTLALVEGNSQTLAISLDTAPSSPVEVSIEQSGYLELEMLPKSLTFDSENYAEPQTVTLIPRQDAFDAQRSGTITVEAKGGILAPMITVEATVANASPRPAIMLSKTDRLVIAEGEIDTFEVNLDRLPNANVAVTLKSDSPDLSVYPPSLTFTKNNYTKAQTVVVTSESDIDRSDENVIITLTSAEAVDTAIEVVVVDDDNTRSDWPVKSHALALPPATAQDDFTLRVHCKEETACAVHLECATQSDGSLFEGSIPSIRAGGARTLSAADIEQIIVGTSYSDRGRFANKGRLGCTLRSEQAISSQVWTRSGEGVLVNNSAFIRSVREKEMYRADIESIPSPDGMEQSNIRIRCVSAIPAPHCNVTLACYDDAGMRYDGDLGMIERLQVRHIQREELADLIDHRWTGLGLSCEILSDRFFTAQVMTRTGGGGALVNNSATGEIGSAGN